MIDVFVGSRAAFEHYCRSTFGCPPTIAERLGRAIHFTRPHDVAMREGPGRLVVADYEYPPMEVVDAAHREVHLMNLRSSA